MQLARFRIPSPVCAARCPAWIPKGCAGFRTQAGRHLVYALGRVHLQRRQRPHARRALRRRVIPPPVAVPRPVPACMVSARANCPRRARANLAAVGWAIQGCPYSSTHLVSRPSSFCMCTKYHSCVSSATFCACEQMTVCEPSTPRTCPAYGRDVSVSGRRRRGGESRRRCFALPGTPQPVRSPPAA